MNIVLKRYLACRTFSKCQPNSNKNCSSLRAYTYKIHADSQLHKCVCGALSIKMTVLQKCPSNVRLPYPQAAAVWWTQSWWKKDWGQRKRYKDSLKDFNMDITTWENAASDRLAWQSTIHRGALHSEFQRSNTAKEKCQIQKRRADNAVDTPLTHRCQTCGRDFRARIGLISHLRTHRSASIKS